MRLFPKERAGLEILHSMARELLPAVQTLAEMLGAPVSSHAALAEKMHVHDAAMSDLQVSLLTHMRSSFINPLPREDLFTLSRALTEAMEKLNGAAELVQLYKLDNVSGRAAELLDIISRQAQLSAQVMRALDDLDGAEDYWIDTLRLAKRADHAHRVHVAELLTDHSAIAYARHRDVADQLLEATKDMRRVATGVGSIIVKEA